MRTIGVGLLACTLVAAIATTSAADTMFLLVPNLQGETNAPPTHVGWIQAESVTWGHGEGPPGAPVKIQFQRLQVVKRSDSTSPALALLAASGQVSKDIKMEFLRTVQGTAVTLARLKLTNARVTSFTTSASENSRMDSLAFSFDTITWITFKVNAQGQQQPGGAACWDVVNSKSCAPSF